MVGRPHRDRRPRRSSRSPGPGCTATGTGSVRTSRRRAPVPGATNRDRRSPSRIGSRGISGDLAASMERGGEAPDRCGELPAGSFGLGRETCDPWRGESLPPPLRRRMSSDRATGCPSAYRPLASTSVIGSPRHALFRSRPSQDALPVRTNPVLSSRPVCSNLRCRGGGEWISTPPDPPGNARRGPLLALGGPGQRCAIFAPASRFSTRSGRRRATRCSARSAERQPM